MEYLNLCRECLDGIGHDENLDFPHSLPICIIDAVFSIGIRYEMAVKNWKNYAAYYHLSFGRMGDFNDGQTDENEHTINDFISNILSFETIEKCMEEVGFSSHRTSPKNGILKLEAALQVAQIMQEHGITTVNDYRKAMHSEELQKQICAVRGQGSGIMLKYLNMLTGSPDMCKPDRWLLGFVRQYYPDVQGDDDILNLMKRTVEELKPEYPALTVRMLDNAIWKYMSEKQGDNETDS